MKRLLARTGPGLLATLAVFAITFFCYRVLHANATVAAVALLLTVLVAGASVTLAGVVIASFAATLCLDYFFIPPVGSITIADPQGWIVLTVFLAVSLIATNVSTRLRLQRDELVAQRAEAEKLHALSRAMLFSEGTEGVERLVVNKCMELFSFREVVLFELLNGAFYRSEAESSIADEMLRRAARNGWVHQDEAVDLTVMPVALGNKIFGSVAWLGPMLRARALQALGSTVAMGIAQAQARDAGSRAEAVRRSEELKSVMIDALAHDLKTPLTAIEAASDMLLAPANVSSAQRQDLLEVIQQEASGLRRIVEEAIHLARIDAQRLKLERRPISVDDLIEAAMASLGERTAPYRMELGRIEVHTTGAPLVSADKELIVQALKQLLDNAMKYSPAKSTIGVSATAADKIVTISVRDHGQGLTELEQDRVFDKFYRGQQGRPAVQGMGMGLAIVKEILEAHGGSAGVRSYPGQGSEFFISLPAAVEQTMGAPLPDEATAAPQGI
jgi:two-component system sensor histidine kinase KdpD